MILLAEGYHCHVRASWVRRCCNILHWALISLAERGALCGQDNRGGEVVDMDVAWKRGVSSFARLIGWCHDAASVVQLKLLCRVAVWPINSSLVTHLFSSISFPLHTNRTMKMDGWADYLHTSFYGEHVLSPSLRLTSLSSFIIAAALSTSICLVERCVSALSSLRG